MKESSILATEISLTGRIWSINGVRSLGRGVTQECSSSERVANPGWILPRAFCTQVWSLRTQVKNDSSENPKVDARTGRAHLSHKPKFGESFQSKLPESPVGQPLWPQASVAGLDLAGVGRRTRLPWSQGNRSVTRSPRGSSAAWPRSGRCSPDRGLQTRRGEIGSRRRRKPQAVPWGGVAGSWLCVKGRGLRLAQSGTSRLTETGTHQMALMACAPSCPREHRLSRFEVGYVGQHTATVAEGCDHFLRVNSADGSANWPTASKVFRVTLNLSGPRR